jgi:hypothetical protein
VIVGEVSPTYCVEVMAFDGGFATVDGTLIEEVREACGESKEPSIPLILRVNEKTC